MPTMSDDEIREAIDKGKFVGLTLDTSIFDRYGCNLDFSAFTALGQFKKSKIAVVLSEMVVGEVKNHIARDCEEALRSLTGALKDYKKRWKRNADFVAVLDPELSAAVSDTVEAQVSGFLEMSGAEIISATGDAGIAAEVVRRYFALELPFEKKADKKSEFPDAFALVSLEAEAKSRGGLMLCVSRDKGWQTFCARSEQLVCTSELVETLGKFEHAGGDVAASVLQLWRGNKAPELVKDVERAIEYELDGLDFAPDATMPTAFESTSQSAALQSLNAETATAPVVIASDEESVTFRTKVRGLVNFEADFQAYSYDSLDKDNVPLGSRNVNHEEEVIFDLLITVSRELGGEPDIIEVEVAPLRLSIDFGWVDVFKDEDPTFEKY